MLLCCCTGPSDCGCLSLLRVTRARGVGALAKIAAMEAKAAAEKAAAEAKAAEDKKRKEEEEAALEARRWVMPKLFIIQVRNAVSFVCVCACERMRVRV